MTTPEPAAGGTAPVARPGETTLRGMGDGHPVFVTSQWAVAGALRAIADIHVQGMERCPRNVPLITVSNHLSYFDIPLIGSWTPRTTWFFSKIEIRSWPVIGWIASTYGTVFVRRGESDRQAVRDALAALAQGRVLGVFPEGHRSHGKGLLPAQPGIALLAQRSGALVWPVAVTGSEHIAKQLRPRVTLTGGDPFDPVAAAREAYGDRPTHQQVADTIMRRLAALLPEHYRGVYR